METTFTRPQATLVDLLDRVLDRGLVINADIIISLAGVPLIGINLRAALAGMETMVQYGLMEEWDHRIRRQALACSSGGMSMPTAEERATIVGRSHRIAPTTDTG